MLLFLCCDLGGTTADWAVYDTEYGGDENGSGGFCVNTTLATSEFDDFYHMMDHFLGEHVSKEIKAGTQITNTTLGVAGPTDKKSVIVTNIPGWEVSIETVNLILSDHGHKEYSSILNDFEALGYGILFLMKKGFTAGDYESVYGRFRSAPTRIGERTGTRSLICGPGTGLGIACMVDSLQMDGFPYIFSSEGGHHTIAPETPEQYRFLSDGGSFNGKQSYEHALSHIGLQNMYNFFRREDYSAEPNYSISSKQILTLATSGKDQAAVDTIELFCELLANFCGNSALTFNCDKALFLWGGALLEMPRDLLMTRFKRYYTDRCNQSDRVARVPVVLLRNELIPLYGCVNRSEYEVKYLMEKEAK